MSQRTKVETFKVPADPKAPAERLPRQPVRSVPEAHGSTAAKKAARDAHRALGYVVRSVSFTEVAIIVYVAGDPPEEFSSTKSGPGKSRRSRRSTRRRTPAE